MRPLAVAGSYAVCLAVALMFWRSASRCDATLPALASADVLHPAAVTERHLPMNLAVDWRLSLKVAATGRTLICTTGPQAGRSIGDTLAVLSTGAGDSSTSE
jgi:hypothetical protein